MKNKKERDDINAKISQMRHNINEQKRGQRTTNKCKIKRKQRMKKPLGKTPPSLLKSKI